MKNSISNKLVFLPGWGYRASIWQGIAEYFPTSEVLLLDLPVIEATTSIDDIMQQLYASIPVNATLLGWSLGGLLGIYFCAQFPTHCKKLVLTASTPKFTADPHWHGIENNQEKHFIYNAVNQPKKLLEDFNRLVLFPDRKLDNRQYLQSHSHECNLNYLKLLLENDARTTFQALDLPIHFILGGKDAIVSSQNQDKLIALNKHSKIITLLEAGHAPFVTHKNLYLNYLNEIIQNA